MSFEKAIDMYQLVASILPAETSRNLKFALPSHKIKSQDKSDKRKGYFATSSFICSMTSSFKRPFYFDGQQHINYNRRSQE